MSKTALVMADAPRAEPMAPTVTNEQLELVRKTVAKDATDAELKLYLYDCARQGVHPLDRLIHFTKRAGKYTPVTSIDFMRMRAADSGEMAGSDDALFADDGVWSSLPKAKQPVAAMVTVYRLTQGQRFAYSATARWDEFKPDSDFMWRKMPHVMLGKCAEAVALRKAFPKQLAGLYAAEEMAQADNSKSEPALIIDTTTGEETPLTGRPEAPEGYEAWAACLPSKADEGLPELTRVFNTANVAFRNYLTKQDRAIWMALKDRAAKVAAS